ncbi:helix-turn-helix transcriptional regulator [Polaribacter sp.]|jgi:DNA-binding HxlR family transcriptional regulator|nr:helix-turn-helix transcriptional regulator [Polaribacter sp.]MDA9977323.1 helix-turn-helix transcriptional regulator [Polaribacter sp.]MDB0039880.1 helix-turn-helix transcriptional regulator [Polaribacter sp.]MDB9748757.1 helix-turn-helix transcriptional regulator [Polaribacter sp.]MDB9778082.1 helix-turn-helix transcriptional regulator [Polaribacter sp.]
MSTNKTPYCPIALSINYVGDKWTLIVLRDMLLLNKTRFKEFKASRGKIATNILSNRLKMLLDEGFIEILDPLGTKKSRQYIATAKGIATLPIIIELYLFSVHDMHISLFSEEELVFQKMVLENPTLLKENIVNGYIEFVNELKAGLLT